MNLGDLIRWGRAVVPECDEVVLPSSSTTQLCMKDIMNEGATEFVRLTRAFPREKKFNCTAETQSYSITQNAGDFLEMREEGVWHYRTSSNTGTWERLKPTTIRELDQTFPSWRTQSSSDQVRNYYQDGTVLGLFYTPSSTVANGLWMYYYGSPSDMTNSTDYPFTGTTTEDPRLKPYAKYLITYYEHKALGIMNYRSDSEKKLVEFINMCGKAKAELNSRRDLVQDAHARPKSFLTAARNAFKR